jgi:hypothetical protein
VATAQVEERHVCLGAMRNGVHAEPAATLPSTSGGVALHAHEALARMPPGVGEALALNSRLRDGYTFRTGPRSEGGEPW